MTVFQAIILGIIQGVSEFLPISSSGHLAVAEFFLGHQDVPILFNILLHIATLGAVITIYAKKIGHLFAVLGRFIVRKSKPEDSGDLKFILAIILATFVTGVFGFLFKDVVKGLSLSVISLLFVLTGVILILTNKIHYAKYTEIPTVKQSLIIGLAQGFGVLPGISRSGSTIATSMLTGVDRKNAGEFSFILSIPAIVAALMLELHSADNLLSSVGIVPLIVGFVTAFLIGIVSLKFLIKVISSGKISFFAFYLIPLGVGLFVYFSFFV